MQRLLGSCILISMDFKKLARIYWFAFSSTVIIWALIGWKLGLAAFFTVIILTLLEMTFSADNAVINSRVLVTLSPFWQKIFMTVGIFVAVFVIRFILPILIATLTASLGFKEALDLALNHPHQYEAALKEAEPVINAFGGTFLIMTALGYFIDYQKNTHWLRPLEDGLSRLGRFKLLTPYAAFITALILYLTVDSKYQNTVLIAALSAILLHLGLNWLNSVLSKSQQKIKSAHKVGVSAFFTVLYLEILDASFSLDGVIGSFAITSSIVIIMAGLGAGAVWVRSMTIHLVRSNALNKYIFLENGAHWAIALLGAIMLIKLYDLEPPEWLIGSLGITFISLSVWRSITHNRKHNSHRLHGGGNNS
jgi:hypothetical protein